MAEVLKNNEHSAGPEVIELLETYLDMAKTMPFGSVAIAMTGYGHGGGDLAATDWAGEVGLERSTNDAIKVLNWRMTKSMEATCLPARDNSLDASYVCYDVCSGPLGWDFFVWLMDAEMTRVREGASGPLKVAFWFGKNPQLVNKDARQMWCDNVFRPALALIGAVEDGRALRGRSKHFYLHGHITAAVRKGEQVPRIKPPTDMDEKVRELGLDNHVTITLREAEHWPHRNSNVESWVTFARDLEKQGEKIVFVRDTAKAFEPLRNEFKTCPIASLDVGARAALYENAKINFGVSNGPNELMKFGSRPFLIFCGVEPENSPYRYNTPQFWKEANGIAVGEQYPWCRPDQCLAWVLDTYEHITAAWRELQPVLRKAA